MYAREKQLERKAIKIKVLFKMHMDDGTIYSECLSVMVS